VKRSRQLVVESAVIASVLVMITLGGSIATTHLPPSFANLQNPASVTKHYDLGALAQYYNATLTDIGTGSYPNASFMLDTFSFVNIPASVNQTALKANADLAALNSSIASASTNLTRAQSALDSRDYVNATSLTETACQQAKSANSSLSAFQGPDTAKFHALSVPTVSYAKGRALAAGEVSSLLSACDRLTSLLKGNALLVISSPQRTIQTGGTVVLNGSLEVNGTGVGGQDAVFFVNGTRFGSLVTDSAGDLGGTLTIPFLYKPVAIIQAIVGRNTTVGLDGGYSNLLNFTILFNQTSIVVGDPPAYLPTQSFHASGNLTTISGVPLPNAPVDVTFLGESVMTTTNTQGEFGARLTVPANATDGTYYVYAAFAPQGAFGPSFNFTSVKVVHLPLTLTVSAPFAYAGFPTDVTGTATANGTGVAGAHVTLDTPWGTYGTVTDGSGRFKVAVTVSPTSFAFAAPIKATAAPSEPYIAAETVHPSLHFLNILVAILPAVLLVTVTYEADKLGAFERFKRPRPRLDKTLEGYAPYGTVAAKAAGGATTLPEPLAAFREAQLLGVAKYGLHFKPSQTIREAIAVVEMASKGNGFEEFRRIAMTAEDYLYAPEFERSRIDLATRDLDSLKRYWS
jgi:hypothetical protein